MTNTLEWKSFFTAFRSGSSNDCRQFDGLRTFLENYRKLSVESKTTVPDVPARQPIEAVRYQEFFSQINPAIKAHFKYGYGINVWDVAGVGCDEMRNSAILSWLLDCNGSHGQGSVFLEGLLTWLSTHKQIPEQARAILPQPGSSHNVCYWTKAESLPLGEKESRVDVEIGGPFVLIIEVKINAAENGDQLRRYVESAKKKAAGKNWGVLFLTRKGSAPEDTSLHDSICNISWKQLNSIVRDVANKWLIKGSFAEHLIMQFCCHIESL